MTDMAADAGAVRLVMLCGEVLDPALVERWQRREGVTADVARDVVLAGLARQQFHRREHRPFRAADAERRRALGQGAEQSGCFFLRILN